MALGNGNPKSGDKGSNFDFQRRVLKGISATVDALEGGISPSAANSDAGYRTRVSELTTLGDLKVVNTPRLDLWGIYEVNNGTAVWNQNVFALDVQTDGDKAMIQSKVSYPYFSGKSQMAEFTFSYFSTDPGTGIRKRFGYYDTYGDGDNVDGFYLQSSNGAIELVINNSFIDGVKIPLNEWDNADLFVNYDWNSFTVVLFDFLWLGGLRLRMFITDGTGLQLAHTVNWAGNHKQTIIAFPSHPVTYEIVSNDLDGFFIPICAQIATEGNTNIAGVVRSVSNGVTGVSTTSTATSYPILAIRKRFGNSPIQLDNFEIAVGTNNDSLYWTIEINPGLSAPLSFSNIDNQSTTQFAVGNGTITVSAPGRIIASGYISTGQLSRVIDFSDSYLSFLGTQKQGVAFAQADADQYVLVVRPISGSLSVRASMQIKEY